MSRWFWWIVAGVFAVSRVATWLFPFDSDHWIFYYVGKHWLGNHQILYLQAWDHKAPLIFALMGGMHAVFGDAYIWHRIVMTLITVSALVLVYLTSKRLFTAAKMTKIEERARISTLLFAFWANLSQFTNSGVNTESFGILAITAAYYCYLRWREGDHFKWLLYGGVALSLAVFLKINFSILLLPLVIDFVLKLRHKPKQLLKYGTIWAVPSVIQLIVWVSYFAPRHLLNEVWIASVSFNGNYLRAGWRGDVSGQAVFLAILLTGLVFFGPSLITIIKRRHSYNSLLMMMAGSTVLFSVILGTFYAYYYLVAMPLLCILAGSVWYETAHKQIYQFVMYASACLSFGISLRQLQNRFSGPAAVDAANMRAAANYIDAHTSTTDKVFFDGYGATFYQLSKRDSGSRYISASHLLEDYREHFGYNFNSKFIGDMEVSRTKYVIVDQATEKLYANNKPITDYLNHHFRQETALKGYEIWVRK